MSNPFRNLSGTQSLIIWTLILSAGCSSPSKSKSARSDLPPNVAAPRCETTPVQLKDLEPFGFQSSPGKVTVARLFRVSCPFCKEDLLRLGSYFQNGTWNARDVQVLLIAYKKEGVEDRKTFNHFMREEMPNLGIPLEAAQVIYIDKDYYALVQAKNKNGDPLFDGWRAVPFGLVFAKDGRLAYRGHFTTSQGMEDDHYKFIGDLLKENCPARIGTAEVSTSTSAARAPAAASSNAATH